MAARKKQPEAQQDLFSRQYIIQSGPWYRTSWPYLRASLPQDERDAHDPGTSSSIFWTSNRDHAERYTSPPAGWTWGQMTPVG